MTRDPTDAPTDLDRLQQRHPGWFFTTMYAAVASGPDRRMLVAQRHGIVLADLTTEALSAKIRREEGSR